MSALDYHFAYLFFLVSSLLVEIRSLCEARGRLGTRSNSVLGANFVYPVNRATLGFDGAQPILKPHECRLQGTLGAFRTRRSSEEAGFSTSSKQR